MIISYEFTIIVVVLITILTAKIIYYFHYYWCFGIIVIGNSRCRIVRDFSFLINGKTRNSKQYRKYSTNLTQHIDPESRQWVLESSLPTPNKTGCMFFGATVTSI
jgi:hypothetical protein